MFLLGDAAACAKSGQKVPQGYYHLESFLKMIARAGGEIGVCGTCMDARGMADTDLVDGCLARQPRRAECLDRLGRQGACLLSRMF